MDGKSAFFIFNFALAILVIFLAAGFLHSVGKLAGLEQPDNIAIKGSYINKTDYKTDLKLFFSDGRFTMREENHSAFQEVINRYYHPQPNIIMAYGSYEKLQEGVYICKGPSTRGFAIMNGNKVAMYISSYMANAYGINMVVFERYRAFTSEIDENGKEVDREKYNSDERFWGGIYLVFVVVICCVLVRDVKRARNKKKKYHKSGHAVNCNKLFSQIRIDPMSTAAWLSLILVAVIIGLTMGYYQVSSRLSAAVNSTLKGSYYTGATYGAEYTMAFTEDRFILQDQNKTVQRGTYKWEQDGVYHWRGEHVDGYALLKNNGIAVYFEGADKLVVMQQHDSVPVTFSTYDDGAYWFNQETSYASPRRLNYTGNMENGLPPPPKEYFPTQDEVLIPVYKLFYQYMNTLMLQEKHDFSGVAADTDEMALFQNFVRYELAKNQKNSLKWVDYDFKLEELSRTERVNFCTLTILCTASSRLSVNDVLNSDSSESSIPYDVTLTKQDGVWLVSSIVESGPGQPHPIDHFKQQIADGSDTTKSYRENIFAVTDALIESYE